MVHFLNPSRPATEQVSVWCERHAGGFRLVRREPAGNLQVERYADRAALLEATTRLQTALTSTGWRPAEMTAMRSDRRYSTRARQFHG